MKAKKIKHLVENNVAVLKTETIIRVKPETVHLETWLVDAEGNRTQRISWMKDQPLTVLNRTQISTQ